MKIKNFLFLLILMVCFTACVDSIQRKISQNVIHPKYSVEKEDLKSRIASILPAEKINITTSNTELNGAAKFNTLHVEISHPETFPSNGFTFSNVAGDIQEVVEDGISNMGDFQKMEVVVRHTVVEHGTEHVKSYKKEMEL